VDPAQLSNAWNKKDENPMSLNSAKIQLCLISLVLFLSEILSHEFLSCVINIAGQPTNSPVQMSQQLTPLEDAVVGAVSGVFSLTCIYPLDM
jgi:hypothetical protein